MIGRLAGIGKAVLAGVVLGVVAGAGPATAATWTLVVENDIFGGTDRNYTAGQQIDYVTDANKSITGLSRWLGNKIYDADALNSDGDTSNDVKIHEGLSLTHAIFTPEDISTTEPLPNQHPYAGWFYGTYTFIARHSDVIDTFVLDLGIVGPSAQGEFVQREYHRLINAVDPLGWDNQLKDEPGIVLTWERQLKPRCLSFCRGWAEVDFLPVVGDSAGNVLTQAKIGGTVRIGSFIAGSDSPPPRIRPSLSGVGIVDLPETGFRWYLFAGMEGRAVARNIFLDGNSFRDSLSVERKPLVADFQAGLVLQVKNVQLAYTFVTRTEEFESQESEQQFGAVTLSVRF